MFKYSIYLLNESLATPATFYKTHCADGMTHLGMICSEL